MDKHTAERFISAIHGDKPFIIKLIHDKDKKTYPPALVTLAKAWPIIETQNANGWGVFFMPNETDKKSTNDEDVTGFRAVFIDIDGRPAPEVFACEPSFILTRNDSRGAHVYWILKEEETDANAWKATQTALINFYGSDKSIKNPARIMRIPGTENHKRETVTEYEITKETPARYSLAEVFRAHTGDDTAKEKAKKAIDRLEPETPLSDGDGRHAHMIKCVFAINDYALSREDVAGILSHVNEKHLAEPYAPEELVRFVDSMKYAKSEPGAGMLNEAAKEQAKIDAMRERFKDWYYIHKSNIFCTPDATDFTRTREGFNAEFSSIVGVVSPSSWLFQRACIKHAEQFTYSPAQPPVINEGGRVFVNLWTPPALTPTEGTADFFTDHIDYLISDPTERSHFLDFCAYMIQNPGAKINHAVLIIGEPGIGKSILHRLFSHLLGSRNVSAPANDTLSENYTTWAKHCQLCFIHETEQTDKKDFMVKMRPFITEPKIMIREMYANAYEIDNHMNVIAMSNSNIPIMLDKHDRRWFVVRSTARPKSIDYYEKLVEHIDTRAGEVLTWLQNRDLSNFHPAAHPLTTRAKEFIVEQSRPDLDTHIHELIETAEGIFTADLVSIQDVIDALPRKFQQSMTVTTNRVARILRDLGAVKLPEIRANGQKKRLWAVRNAERWEREATSKTVENELAKVQTDSGFVQ